MNISSREGLLEVKVRGSKQDLIPYVGKLELTNVPVEGWNIYSYVHDLLDVLTTYSGEVVHPVMMTCGVDMAIDGGRSPEMFLELFPKGSHRFCVLITL